jgi:Tfp pilus assembly protein PilF
MRSLVSPFAITAVFAAIVLSSFAARAQSAAEPPVVCAVHSVAPPAKLIESCTALIDNPATSDADRLSAMITRAGWLQNNGETSKALAEIDAVVAKDPSLARAFRARGEILRQSGQTQSAFDALNQAIKLDPAAAEG